MARVNHKRVKQLLNEHRSKITDRQFFTSRILAGHFEDIAAAQTKRYHYNRRVHVQIYWDPKDPNGACTDDTYIKINAGHKTVTKIRGRNNRYEIISGLFAHELGHVLYTDFLAKQTYMNYLSSYAEFDSIDRNDKYRMMDISARGSNRDGAALRYVAEQLCKRTEDVRILMLVSDGQPADTGYSGTAAEEDLRGIKQEYKRKGILFVAAAIGDDKPNIERIFGDSFLDITDLNQLPGKLTAVIKRFMR